MSFVANSLKKGQNYQNCSTPNDCEKLFKRKGISEIRLTYYYLDVKTLILPPFLPIIVYCQKLNFNHL